MAAIRPESLFRTYFEQLPEPVYVWRRSTEGPYVLAQNRAAAEQAGEREVVGASARTLLSACPELVEKLEAVMDDGEVRRFESDMRGFDGRPCRVAVTLVRAAEHTAVMHWRDATEEHRSRQALEASERERNRIGQDLHDGLAQLLTGANLLLEPIKAPLDLERPELGKNLRQAIDLIKDAIGQTRELARGLGPVPQGSVLSLADSLAELARQSQDVFGLACRCKCDGRLPAMSAETVVNLYRIAQEAVTNAAKHGEARRVDLTCGVADGRLRLRIADDGRGIDEASSQGRGMGLAIMRYRARAIGAELAIRAGERGGTVVECVMEASSACRARPASRKARS